jgi:hypothetical protein
MSPGMTVHTCTYLLPYIRIHTFAITILPGRETIEQRMQAAHCMPNPLMSLRRDQLSRSKRS